MRSRTRGTHSPSPSVSKQSRIIFIKDLPQKREDVQAKVIFEELMAQETKHLDQLNVMKKKIASK